MWNPLETVVTSELRDCRTLLTEEVVLSAILPYRRCLWLIRLWMTDGGDRVVCPLLLGQTGGTLTDTYVSRSSTFAAKCCKNDSFVTLLEFSLFVSPSPTLLLSLDRCLHQVFDTLCCVCWSLGLAWEWLWLWVCTFTCILLSYCSFLQQMSHKK